MTGHGSKFTRKMEAAIAALMTQRNGEEAARAAGIGKQTLIRWQKLPEFQAAYREARRAAVSQATARMQQGSSAAATTMLKTMVDANVSASTRLRAADRVFSHAKHGIENEDIEARRAEKLRQQGALDISGPQGGPVAMSLADVLRGRIRKHEEAESHGEKREETKAPAELRPAA